MTAAVGFRSGHEREKWFVSSRPCQSAHRGVEAEIRHKKTHAAAALRQQEQRKALLDT